MKGSDSITAKLRKVAYINASDYDRDEVNLTMASQQEASDDKLARAKEYSLKKQRKIILAE